MNQLLRLICGLGLLMAMTLCGQILPAQEVPLNLGELNVFIDSTESYTINVTPVGTVHGTRADWFPVTSYGGYSVSTDFYGNHIDRKGGPGTGLPVIGYSLYEVEYDEHVLYVDFRDGDYQETGYSKYDIYIHYSPSIHKFVRTDSSHIRVFNQGETVGIWENGNKSSGAPRMPVTVRNYFNGGYGGTVVIDDGTRSSPCQTIWSLGDHLIATPYIQGGSWFFDHWSDGGARSHSVSATMTGFASVYTAYFRHELMGLEGTGPALSSYPNPFNPSTSIIYSIQDKGHVRLSIADILGRQVAVLVDEIQEAGSHRVVFNGSGLASGTYYCRLLGPGEVQMIRMLFLK